MKLTEFLLPPTESARRRGTYHPIVMSSRVRLARNVKDAPFPGWAKKADRIRVFEMLRPAVESLSTMTDAFCESMENLSSLEKQILVERHLISREHAAKGAGSGVVLTRDESICVMINEEDHLRMQALKPGFQLKQVWLTIDKIDSELENKVAYAFSPALGYLTACPTNVGTGIRVSAMLHLPGLVLAEQINAVIQSVARLGLAVRGLYGEGTEALGNVFQVSNQMTLGESELTIIERLEKVVTQIIEAEQNARELLLEKKAKMVYNHVGRAYGILTNAHSISSKETLNLLSLLRLGFDLGLFPGADRLITDELFVLIQPAHLQLQYGEKLNPEQRDILRADLLRERLANLSRPVTKPTGPGQNSSEIDKKA